MEERTVNRFVSLFNLTTSDNDAEALSAIRMANKILKERNKLWHHIVKDNITLEDRVVYRKPESVAEILDYCIEHAPSWRLEFR